MRRVSPLYGAQHQVDVLLRRPPMKPGNPTNANIADFNLRFREMAMAQLDELERQGEPRDSSVNRVMVQFGGVIAQVEHLIPGVRDSLRASLTDYQQSRSVARRSLNSKDSRETGSSLRPKVSRPKGETTEEKSRRRHSIVDPLLREHGLNPNSWSVKANLLSPRSAYGYLKGQRSLRADTLAALAGALGMRPEDMPD